MKILNASQIRQADAITIQREAITSIDLMERASNAFVHWFCNQYVNTRPIAVFCGQGNNGGDGVAIARLLSTLSYSVRVFVVKHTDTPSPDFLANLERLSNHLEVETIESITDFPNLSECYVLIDALLGSGLSRSATGTLGNIIGAINKSPHKTVSVDIASGLYIDQLNQTTDVIIEPDFTVSFQLPKLAFMFPENAPYTGEWHVVDIGLDAHFIHDCDNPYHLTDNSMIENLSRPRGRFSHKGTFGHALIIAGSYGKMGAAVLASRACLRAGVGLLTMHIPKCGYNIMQISTPEAMASVDAKKYNITKLPSLEVYDAIGIGPGLGRGTGTLKMIQELLSTASAPLVIDADALNLISQDEELLEHIPPGSVLTPHPKEFERLAGPARHSQHRLELAMQFAVKNQVIICLKGANTAVILPEGTVYFNSTGNPGMATGGSGDVLTGIITALLAQGYPAADAARLGVYYHGMAGDKGAQAKGQARLIASDLAEYLCIP